MDSHVLLWLIVATLWYSTDHEPIPLNPTPFHVDNTWTPG